MVKHFLKEKISQKTSKPEENDGDYFAQKRNPRFAIIASKHIFKIADARNENKSKYLAQRGLSNYVSIRV